MRTFQLLEVCETISGVHYLPGYPAWRAFCETPEACARHASDYTQVPRTRETVKRLMLNERGGARIEYEDGVVEELLNFPLRLRWGWVEEVSEDAMGTQGQDDLQTDGKRLGEEADRDEHSKRTGGNEASSGNRTRVAPDGKAPVRKPKPKPAKT